MIGLIEQQQVTLAAGSLARAFFDDPLFAIMQPNEGKRYDLSVWFFTKSIRSTMKRGKVFCSEDASGAALWLMPGGTDPDVTAVLSSGLLSIPFKIGLKQTRKLVDFMAVVDRELHKPSVRGPHWYLTAIGVHPDHQGQGIGSALLEAGTSLADQEGLPSYLETAKERNVDYYRKRGFEVTAYAEYDGIRGWGMVRKPPST